MTALPPEVARRRTFAIISHPDAGKTTLTEKLLLFGGAIQLAGAVKARGDARRARSDWMKVEQERGISVTVSVMTFDYDGCTFNLLDTPGHEDFSEDTYRTLTAVDSAVMVLDAAKGIEPQTRKLFEVCRLRDVPITTFVNKLDRDGKEPFDLLDEIAEEAWAGDILGLPNHGNLRIGDTLTEGEELRFVGIPSFAPELLQKVRAIDPLKAKHLGRALFQLAEEGAAQAFKSRVGNDWIVGVAGALQFDVLADRIRTEYDLEVRFEGTSVATALWAEADDPRMLKKFENALEASLADDHNGSPVFLPRNGWHLKVTKEEWPEVRFLKTKEQTA